MKSRRDPQKRKPLIEKRYRVVFKDSNGELHALLVRATDPPGAVLAAERRLPAGQRISPRYVKGYGWTPQVFED